MPTLDMCIPGNLRDTTTPAVMAETTRKLTHRERPEAKARELLVQWMRECRTSASLFRTVGELWQVADKTSSGTHGTSNNIGFFTAPGRKPPIVVTYLTGAKMATASQRDGAVAEVAQWVT